MTYIERTTAEYSSFIVLRNAYEIHVTLLHKICGTLRIRVQHFCQKYSCDILFIRVILVKASKQANPKERLSHSIRVSLIGIVVGMFFIALMVVAIYLRGWQHNREEELSREHYYG